jgi:hypothetical protein
MKAFPADFLSLFQMLSDDTTAEILFNIKSDPKSKTSITNPNFDEMVNHFKEQEIDISSVYDFMEEKNLVTNLLRNKTKQEKIEIRQNIAKNLEKLIEGLGQRKSRDKTLRLLNGILADDSQSKANIVALNVFLKDSTDNKLKLMKKRYLNPENRAKLIEVIEKKESKKRNFTPKDFYNEKLINLTRVLIEIRAASSEINEKTLDDEAKKSNWETEMSGNLVILRKIVKFQRKVTQKDIKKLISDQLPSLFSLASTEDVKMRSISPDLRRLLYETDSSFVNIGGSSRIKALATKLLESFGTIDSEEIENWFKLVMEGAKTGDSRDTNFMKEITNFKINGKSMYGRILSGKENSSKHTPSFYIRKLLELPIDSNLFERVMKEMSSETILTRNDLLAWKKQSAKTKKQKQAIELDAKKAPDTEERQAFEQEYREALVNSVAVIFIEYMIDEGGIEINDGDYTIINPKQAKESQKAIFNNKEVAEEIQAELEEVLEDEEAEEEYREWLKSEGYSFDTAFYRKRKLTVSLNEEQKFLQDESEVVKTIYSILATSKEDEDKLRNHFQDIKLKDALNTKGNSIKEALSVFYHICNSMSGSLITEAQKIDKEAKKGLTVENESLLQAVRDFATKMQTNLQLFKNNFEEALKNTLDDIAEKPINYPTIYDSPKYTAKLVSYALMKRREL